VLGVVLLLFLPDEVLILRVVLSRPLLDLVLFLLAVHFLFFPEFHPVLEAILLLLLFYLLLLPQPVLSLSPQDILFFLTAVLLLLLEEGLSVLEPVHFLLLTYLLFLLEVVELSLLANSGDSFELLSAQNGTYVASFCVPVTCVVWAPSVLPLRLQFCDRWVLYGLGCKKATEAHICTGACLFNSGDAGQRSTASDRGDPSWLNDTP
jgi:hypothetical protein